MSNFSIGRRVFYIVGASLTGFLITFVVVLPLLLGTVGNISECGFPDGGGGCLSQWLTLLGSIFLIFPVLTLAIYDLLKKTKKIDLG